MYTRDFPDDTDCNPDRTRNKLSSFRGRISLAAVIAPPHSTLLRLLLRTCQFSQCLFSLPYLRVGGVQIRSNAADESGGSPLCSIILVPTCLIRCTYSVSLFRVFFPPSLRPLTIRRIRYFDSCHSDCFAPLIVRQTRENLHVSLAYWESFVGWSHAELFCQTISISHGCK